MNQSRSEEAMSNVSLILTIPRGDVTATGFTIEGLARHRSPGSGKHFQGRSILIDLAVAEGKPAFDFLPEGGWRDARADSIAASEAVATRGKRTKTALSNSGFIAVPVSAFRGLHLVKTGGETLAMEEPVTLLTYPSHECDEGLSSDQVGSAIGRPVSGHREPRLLMVISPIQMILLTNLTPEEYAWYATHRPGKVFRQVIFTEIRSDQPQVAAQSRFTSARAELLANAGKKTKTIAMEGILNLVPFEEWVGYRREAQGGLYIGDRDSLTLRQFPQVIPNAWERMEG
jgi:hypothetical protein